MGRSRAFLPDPEDLEGVIDSTGEDVSKLQGDIDTEEQKITSEFDADNKDVKWLIKVYRVIEKEGKMNWLFNCLPSELPIIDKLRDAYGSGLYRARVYKNGSLYRALDYSIEAPKFMDQMKNPLQQSSAQQPADVTNIVNAMLAAQERQFLKLQEILVNRAPPATGFNMQEAMTGVLAMMVQMKSFLAPSQPNTGGIDMLLKFMEIAKEIGGGGGETNFLDVIRDVVKSDVFGKALEASVVPQLPAQSATSQPAKKRLPVQAAQTASVASTTNSNEVNSMKVPAIVIKQYLGQLISRAERGSDPALYAEFVLDNVADTIYEKPLVEFLSRENVVDELAKIDGRVQQHVEWFNELRDSVISILTDGGDDANTGEDASTSIAPKPSNEPPVGPGGNA